mgnify:CR=1 FL=1
MARPEKIRLGDLLISQGLLTDEQLKMSLDEQKRSHPLDQLPVVATASARSAPEAPEVAPVSV